MATEAGDFDALLITFDRFYRTLDATTVPAAGGGRAVLDIAHAIALSEATDALHLKLAETYSRLYQQHGQSLTDYPPGFWLEESDSPDGPWTPIPASKVRITLMRTGGSGADALLCAALDSAVKASAFPIEKWRAMQAAQPGAHHQRFHAGEVISPAALATLESAAKLLRLKALAPPSQAANAELPVPVVTSLGEMAVVAKHHRAGFERAAVILLSESQPAPAGGAGAQPSPAGGDDGNYRPAIWFGTKMRARLRMAAGKSRKSKRVATKTVDGVVLYCVADARRWWPMDVPNDA